MVGAALLKLAAVGALGALGARWALESDRTLKARVAVQLFGWDGLREIVRQSAAERLLGERSTASRAAFHQMLDTLARAELKYVGPARGVTEVHDLADGARFMTHVLRTGLELFLEQDPRWPVLTSQVHGSLKMLGDNPDAWYLTAQLDGALAYVVSGRLQADEVYTSFTVGEAPCRGCFVTRVLQDVNSNALTLGAEREYRVWLSRERPAALAPGVTWLPLHPSEGHVPQLIVRNYFEREVSVHRDPRVVPDVRIALAPGQSAPPALTFPRDDGELAERLRQVEAFVRAHTVEMSADPKTAPKWFSFTPNQFGPPQSFRDNGAQNKDGGGGLGAVDITYSAAPYKLREGEGLLVEGAWPPCAFASANLWNRYLQTLEYRFGHRVSLNRKQMRSLERGTGRFRLLVSPTEPPAALGADWLDTLGRREGTVFMRVILPERDVPSYSATVIQMLASGTPS
jgi:hypothetical protein